MPRAAATLAALGAAASAQGNWSLVLLDTANGGVCLDGTPGAFYFRPGSGGGANSWILHLQGGGWCSSDADCVSRSTGTLGSSSSWPRDGPPTADGGPNGLISPDPHINPRFYNWNIAFLGYCDGGSYSGTVLEPVTVGNATIYYRGHFILDAFIDKLLSVGVATASEVILKGCSAGGLATYLHADYFGSRLPPTVRFVASPGAGFFLDVPGFDGVTHYTPTYQWVAAAMNVSGSVNAGCVQYYSAQPGQPLWKCFMAQYSLPFITTPLFVINSLADSWQASNIMHLPCNPESNCNSTVIAYLDTFRQTMVDQLAPVLGSTKHGAFLQECFVHVVEDVDASWNGTVVAGQTMIDTFNRWYYGVTGPATHTSAVDGPWGTQRGCYANAWSARGQTSWDQPPQIQ